MAKTGEPTQGVWGRTATRSNASGSTEKSSSQTEQGEVDVDTKEVKAAQEYQIVYSSRDYVPNALRSERDCLASGYEIKQSRVFEN